MTRSLRGRPPTGEPVSTSIVLSALEISGDTPVVSDVCTTAVPRPTTIDDDAVAVCETASPDTTPVTSTPGVDCAYSVDRYCRHCDSDSPATPALNSLTSTLLRSR